MVRLGRGRGWKHENRSFHRPFILLASATLAEARPNSLAMSCASTRGLVQNTGAVVIGTGPNLYDRFVTDAGYCTITQRADPAWLETADEPAVSGRKESASNVASNRAELEGMFRKSWKTFAFSGHAPAY